MKLLVAEEHSTVLRSALAAKEIWSSSLLAVEAHRAALRLGVDYDEVDLRLAAVTLVAPSETSYFSARTVGTPALRTLDALHLASALELGADLDGVVTYDRRLADAFDLVGVEVVAPGLLGRWWVA